MSLTLKKTNRVLRINLVSFDVPYPPNYGGAIDVFYKLKALYCLGVEITLHTFEYGRGEQEELEKYCKQVFYYKRNNFYTSTISSLPFIVKTRNNDLLKERLKNSDSSVLFEGLHTTYLLFKDELKEVKTIVRTHNIEHEYYLGLSKSETSLVKKIFFKLEAYKLKRYQSVLEKSNHILTISPKEQNYFSALFGEKSIYVPPFTNTQFTDFLSEENFILWHGDLKVNDNIRSMLFAIDVVKNSSLKLVIASSFIPENVKEDCYQYKNIVFDCLNNENSLEKLLLKAKVNLLFTYQGTGVKLKLLNALVKSRFVIVNDLMVDGTGLTDLCIVLNSKKEVAHHLTELMNISFTNEDREKRKKLLKSIDVEINAQKIVNLLK